MLRTLHDVLKLKVLHDVTYISDSVTGKRVRLALDSVVEVLARTFKF